MFRKYVVSVLVATLFLFGGWISLARAADEPVEEKPKVSDCAWSNLRFAEYLAQKYEIKLAEGEAMTPDEKYQALANALSEKGITYFSTAKPTDPVKCCDVADALYVVVGATESLGTCDLKIDYLIKNGFLKLPESNSDPCGVLCNIDVVIEPYKPPFRPPHNDPPGPDPEPPSSRT